MLLLNFFSLYIQWMDGIIWTNVLQISSTTNSEIDSKAQVVFLSNLLRVMTLNKLSLGALKIIHPIEEINNI